MRGANRLLIGVTAIAMMATVAGCGSTITDSGNGTVNNTTASGNATQSNTRTGGSSQTVDLAETGSSLLYPLFNGEWVPAYQTVAPNVQMTAASTGSGAGISQASANAVQIGASDAYMSDGQMQEFSSMVNIPLAISAQQIMYHLPGLKADVHLKLTGDILAKIFAGKIKMWNDPAIQSLNANVHLPNQPILPVHRSDGSGDTFLFTQFLSDSNAVWSKGPAYGTTVSWPAVQGGISAKGNDGVVTELTKNPYSISYVGISWLDKATQQGLGYAALQNKSGNFVLPTATNIQAAATAMANKVPADERISLIDAPGNASYPIINFEYAIINTQQTSATAQALRNFLDWAINPAQGNSSQYLSPVHFLPLPSSIESLSQAQIAKIGQ